MRILVAGALGEVGRTVARALREHGHDVVPASSRAPLVGAPEVVGLEEAATLVHAREVDAVLSAAGRGDRRQGERSGLDATGVLGPVCAAAGVPGVLLSTTRVLEGHDVDYLEDAPPRPRTPYAEANARNEEQWLAQGGTAASVLRITNYFCQPASLASPQSLLLPWSLVTEALQAGRIGVRSGPSTSREFVSAADVAAAALVLVADRPVGGVCATTPGLAATLSDLTSAVQGAFRRIGLDAPAASFGEDTVAGPACLPGWLAERGWAGGLTLTDVEGAIADWVIRWAGSERPPNPVSEVLQP